MVVTKVGFSDEWERATNPDDVLLHLFIGCEVVPLMTGPGWVALMVKEATGPDHLARIKGGSDKPGKHQFIINLETARKAAQLLNAAVDAVESAHATRN